MAITALWYDLANEIRSYLVANGFSNEFVTCEPDMINASIVKPVITIEWMGNTGMDIDDDEYGSDRDKIVSLRLFQQFYKSASEANSNKNQLRLFNLQNKLLQAIKDWHCTVDKVTYPLSDKVNWGAIPSFIPATMTIDENTKLEGSSLTIQFHYKGVSV